MEPFYCGHLGDLVKCPVYSGTPLLWTPWGPGEVSCIERCPHFRINKFYTVNLWDPPPPPNFIHPLDIHIRITYKRGVREILEIPPPPIILCILINTYNYRNKARNPVAHGLETQHIKPSSRLHKNIPHLCESLVGSRFEAVLLLSMDP